MMIFMATTPRNPYVDDMVSMLLKTERGSPDVSLWVSVLVGSYSLCEVSSSRAKSTLYIFGKWILLPSYSMGMAIQ